MVQMHNIYKNNDKIFFLIMPVNYYTNKMNL